MLTLVKVNLGFPSDYKDKDVEMLINHYIDTAKEYFFESTGRGFDDKIKIHRNIILLLATHWYENRNIAITSDLDRTLTSMFLQAGLQRNGKNDS